MDICNLVQSLIRKYNTRNPFEILKQKNVILVFAPLNGVRGFYQYFQRNHIIYIDENLSDSEKRFVCAHELGHMLLHKKANALFMDTHTFFNTEKFEIEANTFAANLLISDDIIIENSNMTTEQLSRLVGYEKALIELRLKTYSDK